jgi:hypothetical protein
VVLGVRGLDVQISVKQAGGSNCRGNAHHRGQGQHEANHDACKVAAEQSVDDNEDMFVGKLLEAEIDTSGKEPDQHVEVEEESRPGGRLVLGHGGNDRNVDLGIASVPQGVETAAPWGDDACAGGNDKCG